MFASAQHFLSTHRSWWRKASPAPHTATLDALELQRHCIRIKRCLYPSCERDKFFLATHDKNHLILHLPSKVQSIKSNCFRSRRCLSSRSETAWFPPIVVTLRVDGSHQFTTGI